MWVEGTIIPRIQTALVVISATALIIFILLSGKLDGKEFQHLTDVEHGRFKALRRFVFWCVADDLPACSQKVSLASREKAHRVLSCRSPAGASTPAYFIT